MNHSTNGLIAVTGATGEVGGRVARRLASRGLAQRLIVRNPKRRKQSQVPTSAPLPATTRARRCVARSRAWGTVLLIPAIEGVGRTGDHRTTVEAAVAAACGTSSICRSSALRLTERSPSPATTGRPSKTSGASRRHTPDMESLRVAGS
jgi:hypothetical protein